METSRSTVGLMADETSCGSYCQHPACWQSNQRTEKGFPLRLDAPVKKKVLESDNTSLPEVTVYNLIEDYGEDERDRFPAKCTTAERLPQDRDQLPLPPLMLHRATTGSLSCLLTPESVVKPAKRKVQPKVKVLEVQEVFDEEDLESRWDETFITKQCYVWVPNPNRHSIETDEQKALTEREKSGTIPAKDVTEDLVPEIIEREREETRLKRLATRCRTPYMSRGRPSLKSTTYSQRVPFDTDGINDLLSLPSDILMEVLDHLRDSDFLSKDRIHHVMQDFQPPIVRDLTGISIGTAEALKQKKMPLLITDKKRNVRESHLMETRPVFQLDDHFVLDQITCVNTPVIELESDKADSPDLSIHGFSKYKKPLPAISRLKGQDKKKINKSKIASVSLGLPELPTGIKHTRPFTYRKTDTMDLSIGPMPTPPTSVRSSTTNGSDHGTTLQVNYDSPADTTSSKKQEIAVRFPEMPESPDIANQPAALPATPATPAKEKSFFGEGIGESYYNSTRDTLSPGHRVMVPVNSPTNSESGLRTIPEMSARDNILSPGRLDTPKLEEKVPAQTVDVTEDVSHATGLPESPSKSNRIDGANSSTYSSPDPWPQVTEDVCTPPEQKKLAVVIPDAESHKEHNVLSRSDIQSRESEHDQMVRKIMDEGIKELSPAPPPPSPEGKECERTLSSKPISRESAFMEPLLEENEDHIRGHDAEEPSETEADTEAEVATVSEVMPNPESLVKEKSFHTFVNVDIPAKSVSDPSISLSREHSKLERSVQSFVSIDIPASTNQDNQDNSKEICNEPTDKSKATES